MGARRPVVFAGAVAGIYTGRCPSALLFFGEMISKDCNPAMRAPTNHDRQVDNAGFSGLHRRTVADLTPESSSESPESWVEMYGDLLYRVAVARLRDLSTAEDLVQETFLAAWRGRDTFDGHSDRGTWMVAILRRKIADHYRRIGRSRETTAEAASNELFDHRGVWREPVGEVDLNPESPAELSEFWKSLQFCVEELPGTLSAAFRLREFDSQSVDQACEHLQISRQNLAVRLHRARLLLRKCLQSKWLGHRESVP